MTDTSIEEFRARLQEICRAGVRDEVDNLDASHAVPLIAAIFNTSTQTVDVLSERLNPEVWAKPEVVDAAVGFVRKGGKLRFVLEEAISWAVLREHALIEALICQTDAGVVDMRICPDCYTRHKFNVVIGDRFAARLEPDRSAFVAKGIFYDPDEVERLSKRYLLIWDVSHELADRGPAPADISLSYEFRGGVHYYRSRDQLPGLLVGEQTLEDALAVLPEAASMLVATQLGLPIRYQIEPGRTPQDTRLILQH